MKKMISENFQSFRHIVFRFFKTKWQIVFVFAMASCSVQNQINKDDFDKIPKSFSVSFYDKPDTIAYQYDNRIYTRSLVKDFAKVDNIDYSKPIQLTLNEKELFLKFEDTNKKQHVLKFYGKRHNKRFVFYTNYETVSFPILFIKKEMSKYSIYLPNDNEVIFENHHVNEGMFLLFGAGHSSKSDYKFKLLKDE